MRNSFDLSSEVLVVFPCRDYSCREDSCLHPTSTKCTCFLRNLDLETLEETKWHGLEVGATFPSLNAWPCGLQIGDTLALSSWPQSSSSSLLCSWPMDRPVDGSQPVYTLQSFFERLWRRLGNLMGRWSSWQVQVNIMEFQTLYRSSPSSNLKEVKYCTQTGHYVRTQ